MSLQIYDFIHFAQSISKLNNPFSWTFCKSLHLFTYSNILWDKIMQTHPFFVL